jgi:hypothetical protein
MSTIRTNSVRRANFDHFEPEIDDPQLQKRLRGLMELVDYTAFAANREAIGNQVGVLDTPRVQRMAVACANARAHWVKTALRLSESARPTDDQIEELARARHAFEELIAAYEGVRRLIERGYVNLPPPAK